MISQVETIRAEECARRKAFEGRILCCAGTACLSAEGAEVHAALSEALATHALSDRLELIPTGCMGLCSEGPLVRVELRERPPILYCRVTPLLARLIVAEHAAPLLQGEAVGGPDLPRFLASHTLDIALPFFQRQQRVVLARMDQCDPERIEDAIAHEAYRGLLRCLAEKTPAEVIDLMTRSGLRGRGGGGYPAGAKWASAASTPADTRYVICNGDEGDPGAYMDRSVMEGDPHAVLEGMLIAAYAVGATEGYIYIRAEYELAVRRMCRAIEQARACGLLGQPIKGSDVQFDCRICLGAGAFVCGEETALIASIEGDRGTPRPRPPFPSERGLYGCPTVINNVETFANVPYIAREGAETYRRVGTPDSPGTKVFSLAGRARHAGLIEVAMGTSLADVVNVLGAGTRSGKPVQAVQIGGLSGGIVMHDALDVPLTYEAMSERGTIIGSGGMIILDEDDDLVALARYYLAYAAEESCGGCAACRIGSRQLLELVQQLAAGHQEVRPLMLRVAETMRTASLCGLGKAAARPLMAVLETLDRRADAAPDGEPHD